MRYQIEISLEDETKNKNCIEISRYEHAVIEGSYHWCFKYSKSAAKDWVNEKQTHVCTLGYGVKTKKPYLFNERRHIFGEIITIKEFECYLTPVFEFVVVEKETLHSILDDIANWKVLMEM